MTFLKSAHKEMTICAAENMSQSIKYLHLCCWTGDLNISGLWWGNWEIFYCKFLAESNGERILQIDQHFEKLWTENIVGLFFDSQCTCSRCPFHLLTDMQQFCYITAFSLHRNEKYESVMNIYTKLWKIDVVLWFYF